MEENKDITFSPKYKPLFKILDSWDKVKSKDFHKLPQDEQDEWLTLSKVNIICCSGGRDSGKSFARSIFEPIASLPPYNHSILSTRYTMSTTDKSTTKSLEERVEALGIENHFQYANNTFKASGGGEISITGHKTSSGNQSAKLKSIEDFSILNTEEAEELPSFDEWDKVVRSLRRQDVQCLAGLFFNPPSIDHWIKNELYDKKGVLIGFNGIKDNILYIHTTYLDNGKGNMAEHNWNNYESKRLDYELYEATDVEERDDLDPSIKQNWTYYKHVCLGHWRTEVENVIYENWIEGEFDESLPYGFGLDFGSNDPDALVKGAIDHKNKLIYLDEQYYKSDTSADGLAQILDDRCGYYALIVCDTNERRLRIDLENKGFNIVKATKTGNASPVRRIRTIQNYKLIVTKNSLNLQEALRKYAWHDKRSGVPKHEYSHLPNAFEYLIMNLLDYV